MRIVHFLDSADIVYGGVVTAALDMCSLLASRGHEVVLVTPDPNGVPEDWAGRADAPRVVHLPGPGRPGARLSRGQRNRVGEAIDGAAAVHLHSVWSRSNAQLGRLSVERGVPYVISSHGMLDDWSMAQGAIKKRVYHALAARRLLESAAFVHCTAQGEVDQAKRWFPRGRAEIIPYAFNVGPFEDLPGPDEARAHFGLTTDRPVVLFLSRLHVKKGVEVLLRGAARFQPETSLRLLIAGTGDDAYVDSLKSLAASLSVEAEFVGLVTGRLKTSLYEAADLFVLPTSQENFGLVLPESLACATPVVTTKGVDIWREIESSGAGWTVEQRPDAIAARVVELLADRDALAAKGVEGREWVLREFGGDALVSRFEAMYARAAGEV